MIINLLSSPRNVSTALMYSFAHRGDVKVVDEPFYAYYLNFTGAQHPGKEEIIQSMPTEIDRVIDDIGETLQCHDNIFIKNMAHHLINLDLSFLDGWTNVFLIRDPKQLIASFSQVIQNPTQEDIGIKRQFEIFKYLQKKGKPTIVVDSGELLKDSELILSQLCEIVGLKAFPSMAKWKAGSLPEDGVWAKYWYSNVHLSHGFEAQRTSSRTLPDNCVELWEESLPYYQELSKLAIKA